MSSAAPKQENLLLNLAFNLAIPWAALSYLSKPERLGPTWALVVAVALPVAYGIWDFLARRKMNFMSILGLVSVTASGGLGLLKADGIWFAVKSGIVPALIGLAVLISARTKRPLVNELLYNEQMIDVARIDAKLAETGGRPAFERLLSQSSLLLTASFLGSGALNFLVAYLVIKSPTGSEDFNKEMARLHVLDLFFVTVPSMGMMMFALWRLLKGIQRLTGLEIEDMFHPKPDKASSPSKT
ncbi:MFS transporter [bacterium]|jgi:hypothetical protein|nr:MFS transporter [bacterium]